MGILAYFRLEDLHIKINKSYTFYGLFIVEKSQNSANFNKFD